MHTRLIVDGLHLLISRQRTELYPVLRLFDFLPMLFASEMAQMMRLSRKLLQCNDKRPCASSSDFSGNPCRDSAPVCIECIVAVSCLDVGVDRTRRRWYPFNKVQG